MSRVLLALSAALAVILGVQAAGVTAQDGTGTVTVVHGVPGLTVDVYVNDELTLEGFAPDTVTDPLELPAGDYNIKIFAAGADPMTESPAIEDDTSLPAGANASIIAHLAEDGTPTLAVFVNDVSEIAAGEARLVARHTAAAPAVDVLADGSAVFSNLANPNEQMADVPAGPYSVSVAATGTTEPVIGPTDLTLEAGTAYLVYAVGSLEDDSLNVLTQTITGLGAAEPAPTEPGAAPTAAAGELPSAGTGPAGDGTDAMLIAIVSALAVITGALALFGAGLAKVRSR
jgi:Domain of unknown function (DUF4397)